MARSCRVLAGAGAVVPPNGHFYIFYRVVMDKTSKEALQVAKELTCKFIETRTVSPGNFAEVFPLIYQVVAKTIKEGVQDKDQERVD